MSILEYIYPPDCISCGSLLRRGRKFLCEKCQTDWEVAKNRRVNKRLDIGFPLHYRVGYRSELPAAIENRLILRLKYKADARIVDFLASELAIFIEARGLLPADENVLIAWIPRREMNVVRHGYDHMKRLAVRLAGRLNIRARRMFVRSADAAEQKKLTARERWWNASKTIRLADSMNIAGKTVILLDDIATTGASLRSAAGMLMGKGVREVICVTVAVAEHRERNHQEGDGIY